MTDRKIKDMAKKIEKMAKMATWDKWGYPTLTLKEVEEAIKLLPMPQKILESITLCRKHWNQIEKLTEHKSTNEPTWGSLSGIKVIIKPYLKKVRFEYKNL